MGNCLQTSSTNTSSSSAPEGVFSSSVAKRVKKEPTGGTDSASARILRPSVVDRRSHPVTVHQVLSVIDHRQADPPRNVFDYYEKIEAIGEGATCTIHSVKRTQGEDVGRIYALKTISKHREVGEADDRYLRIRLHEVQLLRQLDHPNIVRVYELFEDDDAVYIIMEHCSGGTLASRAPYTEGEAAKIMTKLLSAVAYCHQRGILHRDLKMDNAMFECESKESDVKLIDFGLGVTEQERPGPYHREVVGTVYTMSPQIIHEKYRNPDPWACGVIAHMLLVDEAPFDGPTRREIAQKIIRNDWDAKFEGEKWRNISSSAKRFVSALLTYDEDERRSASDALRTQWLMKMDPPEERRPPEHLMRGVMEALADHARAPTLKKLALYFIAFHTPGEEVMELERAFDQFCGGYNIGTINAWEFRKEASKYLGRDDNGNQQITKLFRSLATRGKIGFTTFIAACLESQGPIREDRIKAAFNLFDEIEAGFIDRNNLRSTLGVRCRYRSSYLDYEAVIREAIEAVGILGGDKNDSGAVDSDEQNSSAKHTVSQEQFMKLFVQSSS